MFLRCGEDFGWQRGTSIPTSNNPQLLAKLINDFKVEASNAGITVGKFIVLGKKTKGIHFGALHKKIYLVRVISIELDQITVIDEGQRFNNDVNDSETFTLEILLRHMHRAQRWNKKIKQGKLLVQTLANSETIENQWHAEQMDENDSVTDRATLWYERHMRSQTFDDFGSYKTVKKAAATLLYESHMRSQIFFGTRNEWDYSTK